MFCLLKDMQTKFLFHFSNFSNFFFSLFFTFTVLFVYADHNEGTRNVYRTCKAR